MSVLVVVEQSAGAWHRMSWEALSAAGSSARVGLPVAAAVIGAGSVRWRPKRPRRKLDRGRIASAMAETYTADGYTAALEQLIRTVTVLATLSSRTPTRCAISPRNWPRASAGAWSATSSALASTAAQPSPCASSSRAN